MTPLQLGWRPLPTKGNFTIDINFGVWPKITFCLSKLGWWPWSDRWQLLIEGIQVIFDENGELKETPTVLPIGGEQPLKDAHYRAIRVAAENFASFVTKDRDRVGVEERYIMAKLISRYPLGPVL